MSEIKNKYKVRIRYSAVRTFTVFADNEEEAKDRALYDHSIMRLRHWDRKDKIKITTVKQVNKT